MKLIGALYFCARRIYELSAWEEPAEKSKEKKMVSEDLIKYVKDVYDDCVNNPHCSSMYPRRSYTEEDYLKEDVERRGKRGRR